MFLNNVYAMATHFCLVGLFYFIAIEGRVNRASVESLIVLALILYFFIAWVKFRSQKKVLADLLSVVSVAVVGIVFSIFIYVRWNHPTVPPSWLFINFYDFVVWYWIWPLDLDPIRTRVLVMLALSLSPTFAMWLGLMAKRRTST